MLEILSDQSATPWAWYLVRAGGLTAFLLLYVSIFLGVASTLPGLRKIFLPLFNQRVHCWISLQALIFVLIHALGLLFENYFNFTLSDIFIPLLSPYKPELVALGILGFYLMIVLVVTSYIQKYISPRFWRIVHYSNLLLYALVLIHSFYLGTDLKSGRLRDIYIFANGILIFLLVVNIFLKNRENQRKEPEPPAPVQIIPPPLQ